MCEISDHRNKFTQQEDERLISLIKENGAKRWKSIARKMSGKTARQCRDRYMNYLREGLGNRPWTDDEDYLLSQKVKEIGTHWSKIVIFFKGRSTNNIKNRWYTFHLKKKVKPKGYNYGQNFQNISLNNYSAFTSLPTYQQQQQLNQVQPHFNQFVFNYPNLNSGQNICSNSVPSCSFFYNNQYGMNNDYYFVNNNNNMYNYNFNNNSSPNIEENYVDTSSFLTVNDKSSVKVSENQSMKFDNFNEFESDKNDSDINNLLNNDISYQLKGKNNLKKIPSIYELLNPIQ